MKIGILGAGNVGRALGEGWRRAGHEIMYGVKEPTGAADLKSVGDAAAFGQVIVIAVPWQAVPQVLADSRAFADKILIDCTNPIAHDFSGLSTAPNTSAGQEIAKLVPEAQVVKAFNTCGYNIMSNPMLDGEQASMLVASDHEQAKKMVIKLAEDLGFHAVDAGPLAQSKYLENLAWLWISMALKYGHGREIAFRFLQRH